MISNMMSFEEEVQTIVAFLLHPAGFDVDLEGLLCIRPIDENSPPVSWEVDWTEDVYAEVSSACPYEHSREFSSLREAAHFFVEKRRYLRYGLDFQAGFMS